MPKREETTTSRVVITVPDLAEEMHTSPDMLYEFAAREDDPLEIWYPMGTVRGGKIFVDDFKKWFKRNSVTYAEKMRDRRA